jgi:hypothetical protein
MSIRSIDKAEDLPFTVIIILVNGTRCMKYFCQDEASSKINDLPQRLTELQNYSRFLGEIRYAGGENLNQYSTYTIQLKSAIDSSRLQCEDETFGNCIYVDKP